MRLNKATYLIVREEITDYRRHKQNYLERYGNLDNFNHHAISELAKSMMSCEDRANKMIKAGVLKKLPGSRSIYLTKDGLVWDKYFNQFTRPDKYLEEFMTTDYQMIRVSLLKAVCLTWLGRKEVTESVRFKDGDKGNIHADNIYYG